MATEESSQQHLTTARSLSVRFSRRVSGEVDRFVRSATSRETAELILTPRFELRRRPRRHVAQARLGNLAPTERSRYEW